MDRGRVAPVEGTRTSKYFYTGEHWTYFCSYDESSNTGEIVIRENENTDNQEVCQDQNVAQPDGTVSIGSSTYPVGAQVEVDVGIATQGTYRVEVNLEGNSLTSSNVDSQTSITVTPSSNGTLTAELIAPGTWWNPFNNDKLIHTDQAEIVSQSNQSQQDCQEMIENAKQQGQNQMCTDQSMTLQCPIASVTYTASNGCEIDYLKQQGWTAVGGPITGGNQSSNGTADVDLDKAQYVQGEEVEISAFNSKDHEIVVEDPDGQEVQTYQVSGTAQSFSFQTQNRQLGDYTVKLFPQAQNPFSIGNLVGSLIGGPVDSETFELKNNVSGWESYCQTRGFDSSLQGKIDCIKQDIVPNCFTPNPGAQCTQISQSLCQEILGYQFSTNQGRCIEP